MALVCCSREPKIESRKSFSESSGIEKCCKHDAKDERNESRKSRVESLSTSSSGVAKRCYKSKSRVFQ